MTTTDEVARATNDQNLFFDRHGRPSHSSCCLHRRVGRLRSAGAARLRHHSRKHYMTSTPLPFLPSNFDTTPSTETAPGNLRRANPLKRGVVKILDSGCAIVVDGRTCSLAGGNAFLRKRFRKRPCPPRSGHDQLQPSHLGLPTYAPSRQLLSHATVYSNLRILICDCLCILIFAMFLELPSHELHTYMY